MISSRAEPFAHNDYCAAFRCSRDLREVDLKASAQPMREQSAFGCAGSHCMSPFYDFALRLADPKCSPTDARSLDLI
jgi:hypothetical protein